MNPFVLFLLLTSMLTFVAGQLLIKHAVNGGEPAEGRELMTTRCRAAWLTAGIGSLTISFFVQLGLLQKLDLSFVFPFQGLSVIIVTLGASIFLKERLTLPLIAGAILITVGIFLVGAS